jgi:hypothetical protein
MKEQEIPLRIVVVDPPADVVFAVQRGRSELHQVTRSTGQAISFDFQLRARIVGMGKALNWLGPFSQGTPAARFVYVSSGTYAGEKGSCWSRRAKVSLASITVQAINQLEQAPGSVLEASIAGTGPDGGPACASVPLLGDGWCVVNISAP